jgi:hypothetical protein
MKNRKEYTIEDLCKVVAFAINCDNMEYMPHKKLITANEVFTSNSRGELFGVFNAANQVRHLFIDEYMQEIITDSVKVEKDFATGMGLKCLTLLYNCGEDFEKFTDVIVKDFMKECLNH